MKIEILIPIRNPTDVLEKSAASLAAQTDKNFSVLISDNFSTYGAENIERMVDKLEKTGIGVKKIRPPMELERIEHPNWLHYQSKADWLKPLYVGDELEPHFISILRQTIRAYPECLYIFSNGYTHLPGKRPLTELNPWAGRFNSAKIMQDAVLRFGMQFGPPSAAAYRRDAFYSMGGFPVELPICADSFFYCVMAAHYGVAGIQEPLFHMNIHAARFSMSLSGKRRDSFREGLTYSFMLFYHSWTQRYHLPVWGFLRWLARETRNYLKRT